MDKSKISPKKLFKMHTIRLAVLITFILLILFSPIIYIFFIYFTSGVDAANEVSRNMDWVMPVMLFGAIALVAAALALSSYRHSSDYKKYLKHDIISEKAVGFVNGLTMYGNSYTFFEPKGITIVHRSDWNNPTRIPYTSIDVVRYKITSSLNKFAIYQQSGETTPLIVVTKLKGGSATQLNRVLSGSTNLLQSKSLQIGVGSSVLDSLRKHQVKSVKF